MKQIIVVRKDLRMTKGKMSAQVGHAATGAYKRALKKFPDKVKKWESEGEKKVIVYVADDKELYEIKERINDIPKFIVIDAGRTHLDPGTTTCMGIGPWDDDILDRYTGELKLVD